MRFYVIIPTVWQGGEIAWLALAAAWKVNGVETAELYQLAIFVTGTTSRSSNMGPELLFLATGEGIHHE